MKRAKHKPSLSANCQNEWRTVARRPLFLNWPEQKFAACSRANTQIMSHSNRQVECAIPVLPVRDLRRSIEFYTTTLGFRLEWGGTEGATICAVSRDGCHVMLSQNFGGTPGAWVWIGVEDDSLFEEFRRRGVKVRQEPRNYSWAYEMKLEDIDGNVLWFGTETRKDLPLVDGRSG